MDWTAGFPVSEFGQLDSLGGSGRDLWVSVELEELLCGGMLYFFAGSGISGEALSSWISEGLFSRRVAAWVSLHLIFRVITCFSYPNLAFGS